MAKLHPFTSPANYLTLAKAADLDPAGWQSAVESNQDGVHATMRRAWKDAEHHSALLDPRGRAWLCDRSSGAALFREIHACGTLAPAIADPPNPIRSKRQQYLPIAFILPPAIMAAIEEQLGASALKPATPRTTTQQAPVPASIVAPHAAPDMAAVLAELAALRAEIADLRSRENQIEAGSSAMVAPAPLAVEAAPAPSLPDMSMFFARVPQIGRA